MAKHAQRVHKLEGVSQAHGEKGFRWGLVRQRSTYKDVSAADVIEYPEEEEGLTSDQRAFLSGMQDATTQAVLRRPRRDDPLQKEEPRCAQEDEPRRDEGYDPLQKEEPRRSQKDEPRRDEGDDPLQKDEPRRTRHGSKVHSERKKSVPSVTTTDVPGVSTADVPDSRSTASSVTIASPGQQGMGRSPEQSSRHLRWSLRQQQSTLSAPEGETSSSFEKITPSKVVASSTPHKRKSVSPVKRVSTSPTDKQVFDDSDIGEEWAQKHRRALFAASSDKEESDDSSLQAPPVSVHLSLSGDLSVSVMTQAETQTTTTTTTTTGSQATVVLAECASQTDLHAAPADCLLVLQGGTTLRLGLD